MLDFLSRRSVLLAVLVASVASAKDREPQDEGEGTEIQVFVYTSKSRDKAAVVLSVQNHDRVPWSLLEARLRTATDEGKKKPFAMKTSEAFFPEGARGRVAFVIDAHVFDASGGPERLVLEIFRQDGLKEAFVELDPSLLR
ncbi:MAG: DUF2381 family protein [Hyalangium sp.]|uniref:DUF2381 family protein n=1 Tax=Hyalangium sp. TaxID=2028555 RepID=UPI00389A0BD2